MRLACSTASFPMEHLPNAVARVAWAGYRVVEIALPGGEPDLLDERHDDPGERLRASELDLAALHAGVLEGGAEEAALESAGRVGRAAVRAGELGAGQVVIAAPAKGDVAGLAAALNSLLRALEAVPVAILAANQAGTLLATPGDFAALRQQVPSPRFGLALDPGEAVRAGWNPARALERLPETPRYLYLTDARGVETVPPGDGEVGWPALAKALRDAGYDGFATLRLSGAEPWAVEPAAREARFLAQEWFGLEPFDG